MTAKTKGLGFTRPWLSLAMAAGLFMALVGLGSLTGSDIASAHQSPGACFSNALTGGIARTPDTAMNGDIIEYRVLVRNNVGDSPDACDITGADVKFVEPALDGTFTGTEHVLATNINLPANGSGDLCWHSSTAPASLACPAGTTEQIDDALSYTVNVNPGVTSAAAGAAIYGDRPVTSECPFGAATLHDSEPESDACGAATLATAIEEPTPTPTPTPTTPTPTAVVETQTPSPTPTALPAALPQSGGDLNAGSPFATILVLAGMVTVLAAGGAGVAFARRRIE